MSIFKVLIMPVAVLATSIVHVSPTQAANVSPENAQLYQVEVWTHTCDLSNAGTDDKVSVRLDTSTGERFYLDNPGNDRERGDMDYYHVTLSDIDQLSDIQRIQFDLTGNDGWCVDQVWLSVNGQGAFMNYSAPVWLDNDNPDYNPYYKIFSSTLRNDFFWPQPATSPLECRAPTQFSKPDVQSMADGLVGNFIAKGDGLPNSVKKLSWGDNSSLSRVDSNTWRYTAKFRADVKDYYDADITAEYYLDASCGGGKLSIKPRLADSSVKFDRPWWVTVLDPIGTTILNAIIDGIAEGKVKDALEDVANDISVSEDAPICPSSLSIDSSANLNLTWPSLIGTNPVLCQ